MNRFKRYGSGAVYPLRPDELLQARCRLEISTATWGHCNLRITRDGFCEQAEYWIGAPQRFVSFTTQLPAAVMQRVAQCLSELEATSEGYDPFVDADDSGRVILFWRNGVPDDVFIAGHPTPHPPSSACREAFDRLWLEITAPCKRMPVAELGGII